MKLALFLMLPLMSSMALANIAPIVNPLQYAQQKSNAYSSAQKMSCRSAQQTNLLVQCISEEYNFDDLEIDPSTGNYGHITKIYQDECRYSFKRAANGFKIISEGCQTHDLTYSGK